MTENIDHFSGGTSRGSDPGRKSRGTGRLRASFSLVFLLAAILCAVGCDDDARISREKEAAAIEGVIRQVNEINRDFSTEQPKYGEEDAYKEKAEKYFSDLKTIDTSLCPSGFQRFFGQYVQAAGELSALLGSEARKKSEYEARCEKRKGVFSQIDTAKSNVNFIASDYGVTVQMGETSSETEGGEPSPEEKPPSNTDGGSNKNLHLGDISKEILEPVDYVVAQAVNRLEIDRLATKEDVRAVQNQVWIIGGVLLFWGTVCLVLLILIFNRTGASPRLNGKNVEAEQTGAVTIDRNDLLLELAELCYRHGEYSECVRHLVNAKRLGVKKAERMYSRYLDDSKEFRDAAEVYQFLEKQPRPSS